MRETEMTKIIRGMISDMISDTLIDLFLMHKEFDAIYMIDMRKQVSIFRNSTFRKMVRYDYQ